MASVTYDFTQANGAASGWTVGAGGGLIVTSNKISSDSNTTRSGYRAHGLALASDIFQIDVDIDAPLIVGNGGANVWLLNSGTFNGWGIFVGNAVHIQKVTGGIQSNLSNWGRPGEGSAGNLANHLKFTRTAAGDMEVDLDGSWWGVASDSAYPASTLDSVILMVRNAGSPTYESTIDNLVISDAIGAAPSAIPTLWGLPA